MYLNPRPVGEVFRSTRPFSSGIPLLQFPIPVRLSPGGGKASFRLSFVFQANLPSRLFPAVFERYPGNTPVHCFSFEHYFPITIRLSLFSLEEGKRIFYFSFSFPSEFAITTLPFGAFKLISEAPFLRCSSRHYLPGMPRIRFTMRVRHPSLV